MENGEWRNGLFSHVCGGDCGTCLGAWFCSCFLAGRTSERLENFPSEETPGLCNSGCWLMCGAGCCHLHWLVALFKRGETRNKFGIKGDGCTDCLASYFWFPCSLAQMETEVKERARLLKQAPEKAQGYSQPQGGMAYQQTQHGYTQSPPMAHQQNGHVQGPHQHHGYSDAPKY